MRALGRGGKKPSNDGPSPAEETIWGGAQRLRHMDGAPLPHLNAAALGQTGSAANRQTHTHTHTRTHAHTHAHTQGTEQGVTPWEPET